MRILRLHHAQITIPPGSEQNARKFYCDLLQLEEIPKPESLLARGGFWLKVADQQVHVGVEERNFTTKAHLAYEVDDLISWRGKLTSQDIEVVAGEPIPGHDRFEIRDPFGNRIEFIQRVS
jgi:catechol 2,3-dioxygenase-like lactoylglutathione lyase family enzyme